MAAPIQNKPSQTLKPLSSEAAKPAAAAPPPSGNGTGAVVKDGFGAPARNELKALTGAQAKPAHVSNALALPSLGGLFGTIEKDVGGFLKSAEARLADLKQQVQKEVDGILHGAASDIQAAEKSLTPIIDKLFGTTRPEMDKFVQSTADFRNTMKTLRETPPTDPRYQAAAAHLKAEYGYTPENAPKPGALWVSPRLSGSELPGNEVKASHFPTDITPTTVPPKPIDWVFHDGHKPTLITRDGKEVTVQSPEEYKQMVAAARAEAGIKNPDGSPAGGEPKAVHLTMEGGGGLGKRYAAALQEMYQLGVVPTSVSGTSVGAICAGYVAAGADPKTFKDLATDPNLNNFFDLHLGGSGLAKGDYMYHYVDQKLRELTGIKDRPVTFADLKMPCEIPATILDDSQPNTDLTTAKGRLFTFSQETTPNTPVVYAMLASGAFPGPLPTVDLVDPATGRKLVLTDSGVLDGLPMHMNHDGLPELGLSLQEPASNHPDDPTNNEVEKKLPAGDIDASNPILHALNSYKMLKAAGTEAKDFRDRTNPDKNEFMLALPIFDVTDGRKTDKSLIFPYNPDVDPALDQQSRDFTRGFFQKVFNQIGDPNARGTNLTTDVPKNLTFDTRFEMDGQKYSASYKGGDTVHFTRADGTSFDVNAGKRQVEAIYLDQLAFGSLNAELKVMVDNHFNPLHKLERELPF